MRFDPGFVTRLLRDVAPLQTIAGAAIGIEEIMTATARHKVIKLFLCASIFIFMLLYM
jgi:hypothetical protein